MADWLRRILVIDDDLARPDQASRFAENYGLDGFEYVFVADQQEAMRTLQHGEEFALILLDMRFEGEGDLHGLEIFEDLSSAGSLTPVVFMSSSTAAEAILGAWQRGAKSYILKWSKNRHFHDDLKRVVAERAAPTNLKPFTPREVVRQRIRARAATLLEQHRDASIETFIGQARRFKEEVGGEWIHRVPLPDGFENYVAGWNSTDAELKAAEESGALLYLNMDLGLSCTLRCPHCFTMDGAIDERGRGFVPYSLLKDRILEAKAEGLKAVRILGRGEPTQWIARRRDPESTGGDFLDFIRFLRANDIRPLVFSRGQVIGNDEAAKHFYGGTHGIDTGVQLVQALKEADASLFLGVSSIFPDVNNEMVGRGDKKDYDTWCRRAVALAVKAGFNQPNPTHLAVESPITTLNIREIPVRYVLFQLLNISPCANVYMVTGRVQAFDLESLTDPEQQDFIDVYAMVTHFMRRMNAGTRLGPYAGTKECHDVSNGLYLTLNGDVYPCPGFDSVQSLVGNIRRNSLREIWRNNPFGRRPQSICVPKIGSHFPPDFEAVVEHRLATNEPRYESSLRQIVSGLGVND